MSLIGILVEKNHENYLKQGLSKIIPEEQIFFLKENSLQNLKNIQFQTIVIGKTITHNKKQMREIAKKAKYLIFNADITVNSDLLDNFNTQLITYGFNSKATITTSSVEDNKIMVCLQRALQNLQGERIEPQELEMKISEEIHSYEVMELISLLLLYQPLMSKVSKGT